MPNPKPVQSEKFKAQQRPKYGDRPLSKRVVGTRYPETVDEVLRSLSSEQCQRLIREAVEARLIADGLLGSSEPTPDTQSPTPDRPSSPEPIATLHLRQQGKK